MTRQIKPCEVCWEEEEKYTPAILIGLVGHGYTEVASCLRHVVEMNWYVPYVEINE